MSRDIWFCITSLWTEKGSSIQVLLVWPDVRKKKITAWILRICLAFSHSALKTDDASSTVWTNTYHIPQKCWFVFTGIDLQSLSHFLSISSKIQHTQERFILRKSFWKLVNIYASLYHCFYDYIYLFRECVCVHGCARACLCVSLSLTLSLFLWGHAYHSTSVEVRGQLEGTLLPPYGFQGSNAGYWAWQQALLPSDPS